MKHVNKLFAVALALVIVAACSVVAVNAEDVPVLPATEDEVLAYVDFDKNTSDVDIDAYVKDGIASLDGTEAIIFKDAAGILNKVNGTLIVEFVIRPEQSPEHGILFSAGAEPGKCIITGTRNGNAFKYTGFDSDGGLVRLDEWMVVKYVITATHTEIWVDGTMVKEGDCETSFEGAAEGEMKFGQYTVGVWVDPGYVGEVSEIRLSTPKAGSENPGNDNNNDNNDNNGSQDSSDNTSTDKPVTGDTAIPVAVIALMVVAAAGVVVLKKRVTE